MTTILTITNDRKIYECNTISNQNDDKEFTFDKINKKSNKIHCIVDVSQRELSTRQTKLYLKQCKKFISFHKTNIDFAKIDHEKINN